MRVEIDRADDGRLSDYVRLRDASLRRHLEAEQGLFIAEGAKVIRRALGLTFTGVALGLVGAVAATRVLGAFLVDVSATDPATLAAVVTLFTVVAILASWIPARRAAAVDPMHALRSE